jgi:IS30 family transposase
MVHPFAGDPFALRTVSLKSRCPLRMAFGRMAEPVRLSYETIYKSLYAMPRGQLRARLLELMRRQHKTRKTQGRKKGSNNIP